MIMISQVKHHSGVKLTSNTKQAEKPVPTEINKPTSGGDTVQLGTANRSLFTGAISNVKLVGSKADLEKALEKAIANLKGGKTEATTTAGSTDKPTGNKPTAGKGKTGTTTTATEIASLSDLSPSSKAYQAKAKAVFLNSLAKNAPQLLAKSVAEVEKEFTVVKKDDGTFTVTPKEIKEPTTTPTDTNETPKTPKTPVTHTAKGRVFDDPKYEYGTAKYFENHTVGNLTYIDDASDKVHSEIEVGKSKVTEKGTGNQLTFVKSFKFSNDGKTAKINGTTLTIGGKNIDIKSGSGSEKLGEDGTVTWANGTVTIETAEGKQVINTKKFQMEANKKAYGDTYLEISSTSTSKEFDVSGVMGDGLNAQLAFGTAGSSDKPLRSFESFNNGARQSALTESEMRSKLGIKGDENGNDTKPAKKETDTNKTPKKPFIGDFIEDNSDIV